MTWQDIITSQLITWAPPHHAQVHRRFQRFSFHAGGTNVRGNHRQHAQCLHTFHTQINTGVSTHADTALIFRASDHAEYGAVKFISECSQGSRTFKWQHQGFVNAEPVKLGQGWGEDALHDQRVHWFDGLTVPCCWGEEDVFRGKKKRKQTASEGLSQQQLLDRAMEAEGETSRSWGWKRKREHKHQRWRGTLIQFQAD